MSPFDECIFRNTLNIFPFVSWKKLLENFFDVQDVHALYYNGKTCLKNLPTNKNSCSAYLSVGYNYLMNVF